MVDVNVIVPNILKIKKDIVKFKKVENSSRSNFKSLVGFFEIYNKDDKKFLFKPEIRIYNQPQVITSEADIKTNFFKDKFFVINLVKGENYFNIRYQEKPLMIWIWLSTILIAIGGSVSFFKRYEK